MRYENRRVLDALAALLSVCVLAGCQNETDRAAGQSASSSTARARGDRVVVEARAATFFEARVLSAGKGKLRVEPIRGGEPSTVGLADTYALPPSPLAGAKAGQLLICRLQQEWVGCRLLAARAGVLEVESVAGARGDIAPEAVLVPSPLTELNLKRSFARAALRAEFVASAARAGEPLRPPGFRPLPRAKVLVRRHGAWYSATVREIEKEGKGVYVAYGAQELTERAAIEDVVPEPQHGVDPIRGSFALARPLSAADPWTPVRILGATENEFKVLDVDGEQRNVPGRDLLPLLPR